MTVLELAVVLVIIAIIATMLLPFYGNMKARADEARCHANIRNLYVAASGYLTSNGRWPQVPVQMMTEQPHVFARRWVDALVPYGVPHASWICPTLQRNFGFSMEELEKEEKYRIDFLATPFDETPESPRRAPRFPWFIEKIGSHTRGQLIILADGTTTTLMDMVNAGSTSR